MKILILSFPSPIQPLTSLLIVLNPKSTPALSSSIPPPPSTSQALQKEMAAALSHFTPASPSFPLKSNKSRSPLIPGLRHFTLPLKNLSASAYKVTVEHDGRTRTLDVAPDETILERALDEGLEVPHDCKLGVCMTCPARLISGAVDQSEGMLSDDVVEKGYALLCVSYPQSDCHIRTIPEEELLSLQLATAND